MPRTAEQVVSTLYSTSYIRAVDLALMMRIFRKSLKADLVTSDQATDLATQGYLLHHLHSAAEERNPEAVAEIMVAYLSAVPDAYQENHVGHSQAGYSYLTQILEDPDIVPESDQHFASLVRGIDQISIPFEMVSEDPDEVTIPVFLIQVIQSLIVATDVPIPLDLIMSKWKVIRSVLCQHDDDRRHFESFLKSLPSLPNLLASASRGSFNIHDSGLYLALLRASRQVDFTAWCSGNLSSVAKDEWSVQFSERGDLVDLAVELKSSGANFEPSVAYLDALVEYAEHVAEGSKMIIPEEAWRELFDSLNVHQQELFTRRAYEILEKSSGEASADYYGAFGEMLSNPQVLRSQPRFIDRVCRPILDSGNLGGVGWLANVAASNPALLVEHEDQIAVRDFFDRIRLQFTTIQEDDPALPYLKEIGGAFGLDYAGNKRSQEDPDARFEDVE